MTTAFPALMLSAGALALDEDFSFIASTSEGMRYEDHRRRIGLHYRAISLHAEGGQAASHASFQMVHPLPALLHRVF
jgi:hypothetical protein